MKVASGQSEVDITHYVHAKSVSLPRGEIPLAEAIFSTIFSQFFRMASEYGLDAMI